ncbi:hypothetical protein CMO90_00970 [Candidatus Woesearchaeota archaeon]|nr:hypothetical protein [Candidatus Woesearchaeota archaeon]
MQMTNYQTEKNLNLFDEINIDNKRVLIYKKNLKPINNLKLTFREIRDYFAGNVTGITRDEKIAQNIMRLLICKVYDEKSKEDNELIEFANRPNESNDEFYGRIINLFNRVKNTYSEIFDKNEEIEVSPFDLSYIVGTLENYSILGANRDVIGDAFEELIGRSFRGGEGQFFTPRNVVHMMIDILKPESNERIIDPACGSGGFLAYVLRDLNKNRKNNFYLSGIDKDLFLSKLTKIYLTLLGKDKYHIFCENSLENPNNWDKATKDNVQLGSFDLILTNPPFGAKIPVIGELLLSQYELGHRWTKDNTQWFVTDKLFDKQPPQILFIERCVQLLKEGGRAGIVLPEGIFGNPSDRYIWEYLSKNVNIISIVSLAQETFQPSTHTKTSVLFFEKKKKKKSKIFMAIANSIGHDKNGNPTYKYHKNGSIKLNGDGSKIIDDELPFISKNFNKNNSSNTHNHLGFYIQSNEIVENIYIPEYYNPEIKNELFSLDSTGNYKLLSMQSLVEDNIIKIKRGNEIGSRHYGTGSVPFVRTTDIVNWEIKIDPIKAVSEDVYYRYKKSQDIQVNDILFVNDGTFLIGRTALVTRLDSKIIIQSHLRKIRVLNPDIISPYYLFYLLNTKIVKDQVKSKTFVQATISTLGNRISEIILPILVNEKEIQKIENEVQDIIKTKTLVRERSINLVKNGFPMI